MLYVSAQADYAAMQHEMNEALKQAQSAPFADQKERDKAVDHITRELRKLDREFYE